MQMALAIAEVAREGEHGALAGPSRGSSKCSGSGTSRGTGRRAAAEALLFLQASSDQAGCRQTGKGDEEGTRQQQGAGDSTHDWRKRLSVSSVSDMQEERHTLIGKLVLRLDTEAAGEKRSRQSVGACEVGGDTEAEDSRPVKHRCGSASWWW
jgi:hypothetical protein